MGPCQLAQMQFIQAQPHVEMGPVQTARLTPAQMHPRCGLGARSAAAEEAVPRRSAAAPELGQVGGGDPRAAQTEEAALAYDQTAYRVHGDAARLNFPDNAASRAPLGPAVDAKLQTICASIASASKNCKGGNRTKAVRINAAAQPALPSSSNDGPGPEDKPMSSAPPPAAAEIGQLDFSEVPWDEAESFVLRNYPSYEIDWDALLGSN
ncbi:hypothetical protein QOZ80_9BG0699160 [Eleusine coracana subsp. coracana]|nr:hypothetical protein QOZ80_9BG0699160 [Eleusine coracana subsp. coracana]